MKVGLYVWAAAALFGETRFEQIDPAEIEIQGEIGRRIDLAVRKNFLALDLDGAFLQPFRQRKPKEEAKTQQDRFRGLGLQIHAAVLYARYTKDPQVIARKNHLVEETLKTQSPSGYIGLFKEEPDASHLWEEWAFHDAAYIVFGLAEDYRCFGNRGSLDAARKLARYLMTNWPQRPKEPNFTTVGAAEAFFSLYDLTREKEYLRFAADEPMGKQYRIVPAPLISWQQELHPVRKVTSSQGAVRAESCHMYRIMERAMMQLRLNRIEPRENLPLMSRRLISAMTRAAKPGMLITGAIGRQEGWHEDQGGSGRAGETCATVYEMWFLDELARHDGDLRYGDMMERAFYNAFLAAQDPEGRRIRYFTPFSGKREYFEFDAFCCPNNFRRGMGSLPKLIYHRAGGGLAINLYIASRAKVELGGGRSIEVEQQTAYPVSGDVAIILRPAAPARFPLRLRIPRWCAEAAVTVNNEAAAKVRPGVPYHQIEREWRPGDKVKLHMSMPVRFVKGRELQQGRAAVMRGPVVYCLNPGKNPAIQGLDLREIILDPGSIKASTPDGRTLTIRASKPAGLPVVLTEFPDSGGEEIYFLLSDPAAAVDDEFLM